MQVIHEVIHQTGAYPDPLAVKKSYRIPILKDFDGDLSKRWHVDYWVWSEREGKMKRLRKWISKLRHGDTEERRREEANQVVYFLNTALKNGLITPDKPIDQIASQKMPLHKLMEKVFSVKAAQNRATSVKAYISVRNNFEKYWAERGGLGNANALRKSDILEYLNHRQVKHKASNGTRNKELSYLKTVFNEAIALQLIAENPCLGIPMLKVERGKDRVYTQDESDLLRAHYADEASDLPLFVAFIYYGYLRPKREARLMRVSHINLKDKIVFIPSQNSKNGKARYVKIPQNLLDMIEESGVMEADPSLYVFGNQRKPGAKPYSKNTMYDRHKRVAKRLGIEGDLYSWKHTGIYNAYRQGIRMKDISIQCGHGDLNETDRYFKKNGFYDLERSFEFI